MTEYHYREGEDFLIEIDKLTTDELATHSAELLRAYRLFKLHGAEENGAEAVRELEDRAKIAVDTFQTMFRGQLLEDRFLLDRSEDDVLRVFREKIEEMQPSEICGSQRAGSLEECSSLLMNLTAQQNDGERTAIWPYIRKIRSVLLLGYEVFRISHVNIDIEQSLPKGTRSEQRPGPRRPTRSVDDGWPQTNADSDPGEF